jgi:hypothetical protein
MMGATDAGRASQPDQAGHGFPETVQETTGGVAEGATRSP